ncbi:uncharacterized protein [Palaemon carinicauda]|uniref:uncharacterized protein n=1 Tax=Palaemon carinicauda TaxID=392227 RepID=UPI0035B5842F
MCSYTVMTCCCCLSLEQGLIIFGILDLICDLLDIFQIHVYFREDDFLNVNLATVDAFGGAIQVAIALADVAFSIVLLVGVKKASSSYVMIWWWWSLLQISWMIFFGLEYLDLYPFNEVDALVGCLVTCLFVYRTVVARSYALSIQSKSCRQPSSNTIYCVI